MYEDSIGVPFILKGPGVKKGAVEKSPAATLDIFPTCAEAVGVENTTGYRGISLLGLARGEAGAAKNKFAMSEYHSNGFPEGAFAISDGHYKYVNCPGARAMLFDLENDPEELHDLVLEKADDTETKYLIERLQGYLLEICDPEEVNAHAKSDQAKLKKELKESGRLVEEMYKRGYERNPDKLINRPETATAVGMQNWEEN